MDDPKNLVKLAIDPAAEFESLDEVLSEEARFLAPFSEKLAADWADLYLSAFGRDAFFSSLRVHSVFGELVELFIHCLEKQRVDIYLENLKEKGVTFSRLGVPFEEIIVSMHLFEEACLMPFLNSKFSQSKLSQIILAMGELHNRGLAAFAISYFENTKTQMQTVADGLVQENGLLKKELSDAKNSLLGQTMKELNSMQSVIGGINRKLRHRVYQLGHAQKIAEVLESEPHLPNLLKIASRHMLALCPNDSNFFFAFFDEEKKRINFYHQESKSSTECELLKSLFSSELSEAIQTALYDESVRHYHFNKHTDLSSSFEDVFSLKNQKDFLLMPIRRYREVIGFSLLGVPTEGFFSRTTCKFYQRIGQVVSKAVTSAMLFTKSKQRDDFEFIIGEIDKRKSLGGTLETTLDFCLGSLIDLLGVERSSLMRYDEDAKDLRVCAAKGYRVYPISGVSIKWGEGIAGLSLKDSKIISIAKMKDIKNYRPQIKVKSLLCIPLSDAERPLGVLNMSTINYYKTFEKSDIEMANHVVHRMTGILKDLASSKARLITP
ncbi:MAG: hypothetical protein COT00_05005 [Candidatus Omnitrophica bacterium CG07_land_8_20_14_0_80_50_8]|nr:MAG: hypothetical protein AUJ71_04375 [Candidatus Omnitrophica bacterium CG1_02_49_16]PIU39809.1 MAG: hypothetical protein COT00_05005 [Candidatus Omnitrophica bacterium CG07_land_8_20_14_0_80_50_8]